MTDIGSLLSAAIAAMGLVGAFVAWRERALRRDEVLRWANECIVEFVTIELFCGPDLPLDEYERAHRASDAATKTSALVEQGRLLFKNKPAGDWGSEQEPAYRGLRPIILDQIVLAHQIACALAQGREVDEQSLKEVACVARKRFVSLAQQEVGRSRAASVNPAKGGQSVSLDRELALLNRPTRQQAA